MYKKSAIALLVTLHLSGVSWANEISATSDVTTSYVSFDSDSDTEESRGADNYSVEPTLGVKVRTNRIEALGNIRHQYLERHFQNPAGVDPDSKTSDSYTNYTFAGSVHAIDDILSVNVNTGQSYRDLFSSGEFINDEFFGSEELARTKSYSSGLTLSVPNNGFFGLSGNASYGKVKSDRQSQSTDELNSTNKRATIRMFSGDEISNIRWDVSNEYRDTSNSSSTDFVSRVLDASLSFGLYKDVNFLMLYTKESNESELFLTIPDADLGSERIGAGLAWYAGEGRKLELSYNKSTEGQSNEEHRFIGVDMDWRFSSRTSIAAKYDRRFFGETGSFSLSHNSRRFRTRVSYSENITTFSRLVQNIESLGVFVCPNGQVSLSDCFLPDTITYELQPGEQFAEFNQNVPEINEDINLYKSLNINFGYEGRKLGGNISLRRTRTEIIGSNSESNINAASFVTTYKAGVHTSFNFNINYSENERLNVEGQEDIISATLGVTRHLSRSLDASLSFRYSDRDSFQEERSLTDKRITLSLNYLVF